MRCDSLSYWGLKGEIYTMPRKNLLKTKAICPWCEFPILERSRLITVESTEWAIASPSDLVDVTAAYAVQDKEKMRTLVKQGFTDGSIFPFCDKCRHLLFIRNHADCCLFLHSGNWWSLPSKPTKALIRRFGETEEGLVWKEDGFREMCKIGGKVYQSEIDWWAELPEDQQEEEE